MRRGRIGWGLRDRIGGAGRSKLRLLSKVEIDQRGINPVAEEGVI